MARAWWQGSAAELLKAGPDAVLGRLVQQLPFPAEPRQTEAWRFTIGHLAALGHAMPEAHVFLEFAIPRMGRRADAVVVAGGHVFVLEYKVGTRDFARHALAQVEGYALDLRHFHETSHDVPLVPMLVATHAPPQPIGLGLPADGISPPMRLAACDVEPAIRQVLTADPRPPLDAAQWAAGAYRPTPTIIEAAEALFRGHGVEEISRSGAGAANLTRTADAVARAIAGARATGTKALVFITGVPGAGKTLAGLNIACARMAAPGVDSAFLTGNGPLVAVLREALRRDHRRRARAPEPGDPDARRVAARSPDAFIQNVHHFRDEHVATDRPPPEHVVVFDEAQRAWDAAQTARFMRKRGHPEWTMSEPAFLLSVMDRRPDWCAVVCLVGEGQEINTGEAGIGAWLEAVAAGPQQGWRVHHSPHLARADEQSRRALAILAARGQAAEEPDLHLATSMRSFRAGRVSDFVAALLADQPESARALLPVPEQFPIFRTRSLPAARAWLRARRRGTERAGLLAASNALRLRPEGLHVRARVDVAHWFLEPPPDIRACDMLEDVATEFDVQGLELDWTCVAWDLGLRRARRGWEPWAFRGSAWQRARQPERQAFIVNAHRVLLTRARQGMVIFVPQGDPDDPTRPPAAYAAIDAALARCGIPELPGSFRTSPS